MYSRGSNTKKVNVGADQHIQTKKSLQYLKLNLYALDIDLTHYIQMDAQLEDTVGLHWHPLNLGKI